MSLPASDTFTGSDGTQLTTYSANWSLNSGDFDIQSNALAPDAAITECGAHWNADSFNNDQYAKVTLIAELAVPSVGPAVRCAGAGTATYYGLYNATTGIYIFKMVGGTWTQLGATVASAAVNDVLKLSVSGTTLTYNLNGVDRTTRTDSAIASGSAGVCGYEDNAGARMDNWEGGDIGGGAAGHPTAKRLGLVRFVRPVNFGREGAFTFFQALRGLLWPIMFRMGLCPIR